MKKNTRFLLSAVLALVLPVTLMALPAFADDAETAPQHLHCDANGNDISFQEWSDPTSLPDGGAWYLSTDVTLQKKDWGPTEDTKLCLNGHVISCSNGQCLWLEEVSLDLYDEPEGATHYFQYNKGSEWTYLGDSTSQSAVSLSDFSPDTVSEGAVIAVPGGVITGRGMFIRVCSDRSEEPGAHFNMYGGSIAGICADNTEPVSLQGDVAFTMTGGSIAGNFYPYGNTVLNRFGSVALLGGTITGNTVSGAVVCCKNEGTVTVAGSTDIHGNVSGSGAVYAEDGGITAGGSARVTGNTTAGGTACNVRVNSGHPLALDAPAQGMAVGVSTENAPTANAPVLFSGSAAEGDAACFFSDAGYTVSFRPTEGSDSALYLTENSGLASVFGNGSIWLILVLAAVTAAGAVCAVIYGRKKKVQ